MGVPFRQHGAPAAILLSFVQTHQKKYMKKLIFASALAIAALAVAACGGNASRKAAEEAEAAEAAEAEKEQKSPKIKKKIFWGNLISICS